MIKIRDYDEGGLWMEEIKAGFNKYFIGDEDNPKAEVIYKASDDGCIRITHTMVSNELRGQGIGQKLIKRMVDHARQENLKVIPVCSYARAEFEKNREYEDILKK
jgi:predicted GNAT family acetyltransferase